MLIITMMIFAFIVLVYYLFYSFLFCFLTVFIILYESKGSEAPRRRPSIFSFSDRAFLKRHK